MKTRIYYLVVTSNIVSCYHKLVSHSYDLTLELVSIIKW